MKQLSVQIWSDIACPWCYVGKRRLESALAEFPERDSVNIEWRAFELDPTAPAVIDSKLPYPERLARKYGTSAKQAQAMIDRMVSIAAADGLSFDFENIRPGNTFDAHRLLHLAKDRGLQDELKERLFRTYMTEGQAIGDRDVLRRVAEEVGLDADEVNTVLVTDQYAKEVREDQAEARAHGVNGVPFFVIGRYGVSGAQPAELLREVLEKAWNEAEERPEPFAEGAVCGPDGCM